MKAKSMLCVFAAGVSGFSGAGWSDESGSIASKTGIEQVIVNARRVEENAQDVPLAITAVNDAFLRENSVNNLQGLNGQIPALRIDSFNSPLYANLGIRAQRSTNVAPGQDSAVSLYFAEFVNAFPVGTNQQMFDLQSVETIKGPQGTLFGRNTTGGAISITPAKPTEVLGGSITAGYTNFKHGDGYYTTGVFNAPVNDVLKLRAAINIINHDGYVKNTITPQQQANYELVPFTGTSNRDLNDADSKAWRVSALLTPSDRLESYFLLQGGSYSDNGTAYSLTGFNPVGYTAFALGIMGLNPAAAAQQIQSAQSHDFWSAAVGAKAGNDYDGAMISNTTTWELSDTLTLKNVIGYRDFRSDQVISFGLPYQILDAKIADDGHEVAEEIQLQGQTDNLNWVAGLYYFDQHIDHPNSTIALPQFGTTPFFQHSIADNKSYAAFVQGTYRLTNDLSFTAGLRHTTDEREMEASKFADASRTICGLVDGGGAPLPASACSLSGNVTYREPTYNLTLDYKADADTLLYVAHRKGYRSGGWNYTPNSPQTFGPFKPEYVNDWEVGGKRDWYFGTTVLRTNLAIYHQKYDDAQRFLTPASDPTAFNVINAATATINGGELELTLVPFDGLELGGFVSVIDAEYDEFRNPSLFVGDFTNNKFGQVPETQYSLRARYLLPLNPSIGEVTLLADYMHYSKIYYTDTAQGPTQGPNDSQFQDAYGLLNFRADWKSVMSSNVDVAAYVRNANNEKYNSFGVMLWDSLGYNTATIGEPRIVGIEATLHF
jgi:iron complex outermembrane receptor protein